MPKSSTLTRSPPGDIGSGTRNRFSGFRSRCTISSACDAATRARRLDGDVHRLADAQTLARQPPRQRLAVQVLHHDVRDVAVDHPDVDHLDDVRMMDGRRGPCLVDEARDQRRALEILAFQKLHRRPAPQHRVLGQVDDAHGAVADELAQLVVIDLLADHAGWITRIRVCGNSPASPALPAGRCGGRDRAPAMRGAPKHAGAARRHRRRQLNRWRLHCARLERSNQVVGIARGGGHETAARRERRRDQAVGIDDPGPAGQAPDALRTSAE